MGVKVVGGTDKRLTVDRASKSLPQKPDLADSSERRVMG